MALDLLKWLGLVEKKSNFVRGERLQSKKIAKTVRHVKRDWARTSGALIIEDSPRNANPRGSGLDAVHQHHSFFGIDFAQAYLDDFRRSRLHRAAHVLGLDGHFAMPRSIRTESETRFGRPRSKIPFIAARM